MSNLFPLCSKPVSCPFKDGHRPEQVCTHSWPMTQIEGAVYPPSNLLCLEASGLRERQPLVAAFLRPNDQRAACACISTCESRLIKENGHSSKQRR